MRCSTAVNVPPWLSGIAAGASKSAITVLDRTTGSPASRSRRRYGAPTAVVIDTTPSTCDHATGVEKLPGAPASSRGAASGRVSTTTRHPPTPATSRVSPASSSPK
ncbi:hypothetical protein GALL_353210 [mine drainage metagenome]|uniref:Uncharacterized protein n=1 Tax=mine drainage metagenome TaxID=410659 RepID=A0A1J5QZN1_9ZZZZ